MRYAIGIETTNDERGRPTPETLRAVFYEVREDDKLGKICNVAEGRTVYQIASYLCDSVGENNAYVGVIRPDKTIDWPDEISAAEAAEAMYSYLEERNAMSPEWRNRFREEFVRLGGPPEVVDDILCNIADDPGDEDLRTVSPEECAKTMYDLQEEE